MSDRRRRRLPLVVLVGALVSCGYQLGAGAARMPPGAEKVFVRAFENRTTDAEAGALVATSLRAALARRHAQGDGGSPARIEGIVEQATFGASSPNGATYRLGLVVSARLIVQERVVAEHRAASYEDWLAGLDPLESEGRRRLALRRAAETIARDLLDRFEVVP